MKIFHKILQDLKSRYKPASEKAIAIYGLDADLIFLAMASGRKNIYLVREADQFRKRSNCNEVTEPLLFVDMDETAESINTLISDIIRENISFNPKVNLSGKNFIPDYILISFFFFLFHFKLTSHSCRQIVTKQCIP